MKGLGIYFIKYKFYYLFALVCLYLGIYLDLKSPGIIGKIIDDVIVGGQTQALTGLLFSLLGVGVGRGVFKYLQEFTGDCVGARIGEDLRRQLFDHAFFSVMNTVP